MSFKSEQVEMTVHYLLYIIQQMGGHADFHKVFKILYFADQKHLVKYGSSISDDKYIAMKNGPVPSLAYDVFKALRGEGMFTSERGEFQKFFTLDGSYKVRNNKEPDMENFSVSEIQCLDESLKENRKLSFDMLTNKSHDAAWDSAYRDDHMSLLNIAKAGGATSDTLRYIKEAEEMQHAHFE